MNPSATNDTFADAKADQDERREAFASAIVAAVQDTRGKRVAGDKGIVSHTTLEIESRRQSAEMLLLCLKYMATIPIETRGPRSARLGLFAAMPFRTGHAAWRSKGFHRRSGRLWRRSANPNRSTRRHIRAESGHDAGGKQGSPGRDMVSSRSKGSRRPQLRDDLAARRQVACGSMALEGSRQEWAKVRPIEVLHARPADRFRPRTAIITRRQRTFTIGADGGKHGESLRLPGQEPTLSPSPRPRLSRGGRGTEPNMRRSAEEGRTWKRR